MKLSLSLSLALVATVFTNGSLAYAESAKIDFTASIFVDGNPVIDEFKCPMDKDGKRSCDIPMTLGELIYYSLERPIQNQNWADAIKRDDLARAIRTATDFTLIDDQRTMIENALGPLWSPPILGAVAAAIDPKRK